MQIEHLCYLCQTSRILAIQPVLSFNTGSLLADVANPSETCASICYRCVAVAREAKQANRGHILTIMRIVDTSRLGSAGVTVAYHGDVQGHQESLRQAVALQLQLRGVKARSFAAGKTPEWAILLCQADQLVEVGQLLQRLQSLPGPPPPGP